MSPIASGQLSYPNHDLDKLIVSPQHVKLLYRPLFYLSIIQSSPIKHRVFSFLPLGSLDVSCVPLLLSHLYFPICWRRLKQWNSEDSLGFNYSPLVFQWRFIGIHLFTMGFPKWPIVIKSQHWAWRTFSKLCWHFSCRTCGAWSCFNASRSVEHVNMRLMTVAKKTNGRNWLKSEVLSLINQQEIWTLANKHGECQKTWEISQRWLLGGFNPINAFSLKPQLSKAVYS